jgi:uncharacterized protein YegP (UPF0339 family)
VPFGSLSSLATVDIALLDADASSVAGRDSADAAKAFDSPKARSLGRIPAARILEHPDWPGLARTLGVQVAEGRFEVYADKSGRFRWRLVRNNGEIVADSGQGYATREALENDLGWIRRNAAAVSVEERTNP